MLGIGARLWRRGYNVLLFDYRGHGEHAGTRVTLGYREVEDALAAVRYAFARLPERTAGPDRAISMGAAVAIMAAAREPTRSRWSWRIARSPPSAIRSAGGCGSNLHVELDWPAGACSSPITAIAGCSATASAMSSQSARSPRSATRPILLIHGTADTMIESTNSSCSTCRAGRPKELWLLPGVEHCGAYFADRPALCRAGDPLLRPRARRAAQRDSQKRRLSADRAAATAREMQRTARPSYHARSDYVPPLNRLNLNSTNSTTIATTTGTRPRSGCRQASNASDRVRSRTVRSSRPRNVT